MKSPLSRLLVALVAFVSVSGVSHAFEMKDLEGSWKGSYKDPAPGGSTFPLLLDIWAEQGVWRGYFVFGGLYPRPMHDLAVKGDRLSFRISNAERERGDSLGAAVVKAAGATKKLSLKIDESAIGVQEWETAVEFTFQPPPKSLLKDDSLAGTYTGEIPILHGPGEPDRTVPIEVRIKIDGDEVGASVKYRGTEHKIDVVRRVRNHVYLEWKNEKGFPRRLFGEASGESLTVGIWAVPDLSGAGTLKKKGGQ